MAAVVPLQSERKGIIFSYVAAWLFVVGSFLALHHLIALYPMVHPQWVDYLEDAGFMTGTGIIFWLLIDRHLRKIETAARRLRESEARFGLLMHQAADAFFVHDVEGRILDVNHAACWTLGYSREELLALTVRDVEVGTPPELLDHTWQRLEEGKAVTIEGRHRRKDGSEFPVEVRLGMVRTGDNRMFVAIVRDVTERNRIQQAILAMNQDLEQRVAERTRLLSESHARLLGEMAVREQSEKTLREIYEGTAALTGVEFFRSVTRHLASALNVRYTFVGELLDGAPRRVRTLAVWGGSAFLPNAEYEIANTPCGEVVERAATFDCASVADTGLEGCGLIRTLGATSYLGTPLRTLDGRLLGILAVMDTRPIAETDSRAESILAIFAARAAAEMQRVQAEEALQASRARLAGIINGAMDAIVSVDSRYRIIMFNPAAEVIFRCPAEEALGQPLDRFIPQPQRERHRQQVAEFGRSGATRRSTLNMGSGFMGLRADGEAFPFEASISKVESRGETLYTAILRDVTQRKQAEYALLESEERFRRLTALSSDWYWEQGPDLRFAFISQGLREKSGFLPADFIGKAWWEVGFEGVTAQQWQDHKSLMAERKPFHHFLTYRRNPNGELRIVASSGEPVFNAMGAFCGYRGVSRDITEQWNLREQAREGEQRLVNAAHLVTLGEMATTLAHELNQPLTAIAGYAEGSIDRLRSGKANTADLEDAMSRVAAQALRAGDIVRSIRSFARKRDFVRTPVDLNQVVREMAAFSEHQAGRNSVTVSLELAPGLPRVPADKVLVELALVNLIRNGIESMAGVNGRAHLGIGTGLDGAGKVRVWVSDSGRGVAAATAGSVFDPFFTTKPEGMGMGLAISRSIVESHGGTLWFEPNAGPGTTFCFSLPVDER